MSKKPEELWGKYPEDENRLGDPKLDVLLDIRDGTSTKPFDDYAQSLYGVYPTDVVTLGDVKLDVLLDIRANTEGMAGDIGDLIDRADETDVEQAAQDADRQSIKDDITDRMMHWDGYYDIDQGDSAHLKNAVVAYEGWTMIANKDTTEFAIPRPIGSPMFGMDDAPVWTQGSQEAVVFTGHLYVLNQTGYIRGLRVWVPELTGTTNYRFIIIKNPNSQFPTYMSIEEPVLIENDWTILTVGNHLYLAGDELLVYIDALDSGASTSWQYPWTYGGSGNVNPLAGEWTKNNGETELRIAKDDGDGTNHAQELDVIPGTTFTITQLDDPNKSLEFLTLAVPVDNGTFYTYPVSEAAVGPGGIPDVGVGTQIRAVQPIASPTKYVELADYWATNQPTWATVSSYKQYNGVTQPGSIDDAHGVDIAFQQMDIPEDWDVMAVW